MNQVLLFVLLGLGSGGLIAALATSLVVNYRGSGTVNMAVGAIALAGAYTFYGLRTEGYLWLVRLPGLPDRIDLGGPWSTVPALLVSVLVCIVIGLLFDLVVLRPLRTAAPLAKLLASLGLFIVIQASVGLRFGASGQQAPSVFPNGPDDVLHIVGAAVPLSRIWIAASAVAVAVLLALFYRYTRFGIVTRAAAENETLAQLAGFSPGLVSAANTAGAAAVAGLFGCLTAALIPLDPVTIPLIVVPALAAALLGRFTSFGITVAAGLAMGVAQSLLVLAQSKSWFPTSDGQAIPGVSDLLFFLAVVAAVLLRGSSLPQRGALIERALPRVPAARRAAPGAAAAVTVIVIACLMLPFGFRQALINSLIGVIVCLSLVLITGFVGQVSLIQIALAGVSGFVVSIVATHAGLGFPIGPLLGVATATLLGLVTGLSALRVRGVNLAIVSIAAAAMLQTFGFQNPIWGAGTSTLEVPQPSLLGVDLGTTAPFPVSADTQPSPVFGLLCGGFAVLTALFVINLRRSHLGKRMLAVRSEERAAAAAGISVRNTKLIAFGISSAVAGLAGVLYAYDFGSVGASRFDLVLALTFIAFAYIGGITTVLGAVVGGLGVSGGILAYVLNTYTAITPQYQALIGGLALMVAITRQPEGVAGVLTARRAKKVGSPPVETQPATSRPTELVQS